MIRWQRMQRIFRGRCNFWDSEMPIGRQRLGSLLNRLVSVSAEEREGAAENVSDWSQSLDSFEARVLVRIMAAVIYFEGEVRSREAELNALVNIFDPSSMSFHDIEPVLSSNLDKLGPSEREYLGELRQLLG
jgi:hypothetical protein